MVISTIKEVQGFKQISTVTAQKFEVFSRKFPLLSNYAWIQGWLFLTKAVGRGGQRGTGKELGEGRGEDKRLKKSGHSIRSKWLQPTIWYHGDSRRLRKIESERLIHPPFLLLVSFYSDELVHLEKNIFRNHTYVDYIMSQGTCSEGARRSQVESQCSNREYLLVLSAVLWPTYCLTIPKRSPPLCGVPRPPQGRAGQIQSHDAPLPVLPRATETCCITIFSYAF